MGARRSQDLMRSEDSMLIPKKEFEILRDQSLHLEVRRADYGFYTSEKKTRTNEKPENLTMSEKKFISEKLTDIDVSERRSPQVETFENQYRKRRIEGEEPSRENIEERYESKEVNIRGHASPILQYISNNSSPNKEKNVQNGSELNSFNKSGQNQTQDYEVTEEDNTRQESGEKETLERTDIELRIGESLEEQGDMDISAEMTTFGAADYASQAKLQEQINRSAAKIMQLLNIQPSENSEDKENTRKSAKMFGREPYKTAKFAGLELYQSEDASKEEVTEDEDALKEREPWKQENNENTNVEFLQTKGNQNLLNLTLGEKMKFVLREGKENLGGEVSDFFEKK